MIKRIIKTAVCLIILAFISAQLIFSFKNRLSFNKVQREIFAMDTVMQLTAYGKNAETAVSSAVAEINKIDALCDPHDKNSDIFKINAAAGKPLSVSEQTAELIKLSIEISEKTGGAFDISAYPAVKAWGFTTKDYRIPDRSELEDLKQRVGYEKITVDEQTVRLDGGAQISLAAVAKGYAARRADKIMRECGVTSAVIWLGGNVQVIGRQPDGSKWQIGIQNPNAQDGTICSVLAEDTAVVTSGNYQRFFEADGKKYGHIIDMKTCCPADNDLLSVTIVCADGAYADGLSTALFSVGYDKAIEIYRRCADFDAVLVKKDGTVIITDGIARQIADKNTDEFRFETVGLE